MLHRNHTGHPLPSDKHKAGDSEFDHEDPDSYNHSTVTSVAERPDTVVELAKTIYLRWPILCQQSIDCWVPFDGLTPLRGEWDEYFLLRALFNRRETKMSPQTYR